MIEPNWFLLYWKSKLLNSPFSLCSGFKMKKEGEKNRKVPFCLPWIGREEINEVVATLKSGWLTTGPKTKLLEEKLCKYNKIRNAVAVNSCTSALHLALAASDIKPGDEVITTPLTFCSTVNAALQQGALPVLADVDERTYNISPTEIEKKITDKTKAIIAVHFGGQPCDMDAISKIAEEHNLLLIEDAAHAIGAEYGGKKAGTIGKFGCYSFYPIKNMTTAEGGAIVTDDDAAAAQARCLSYCGISKDAWRRYAEKGSWYYEVTQLGFKYNMNDVLASIGLHQIDKLDKFISLRRKIAGRYNKAFAPVDGITTPFVEKNVKHAWHLYPILLNVEGLRISRNQFIAEMGERGIGTSVHFIPIHFHPYYKKQLGYREGDFPKAEHVFERIVSLPIYPKMPAADVEYVASAVLEIIEKNRK
jgi:dTDP-4-amino-4,6-dideoxygalactose transaminase